MNRLGCLAYSTGCLVINFDLLISSPLVQSYDCILLHVRAHIHVAAKGRLHVYIYYRELLCEESESGS